MKLIIAVSGASGIIYSIRLLEVLRRLRVEIHLIVSEWAICNLHYETDKSMEELKALATVTYSNKQLDAPLASGSFISDGMIVVPCSMKSLSAIAHGYSDSLLVRAADVMLKERRKLILVPRETPLNRIHLNNMLLADQAGAVIMPPMPSFYNCPQTVDDIINHTVSRILDHFGLESGLAKRWKQA